MQMTEPHSERMTPTDLRPAEPGETPLSPAEVMHGLQDGLIAPGPGAIARADAGVTGLASAQETTK